MSLLLRGINQALTLIADFWRSLPWNFQRRAPHPWGFISSAVVVATIRALATEGKSPSAGPVAGVAGNRALPLSLGAPGRRLPTTHAVALISAGLLLPPAWIFMAAETALLALDPPWSMTLPGETMTLRCWGSHSLLQHPAAWYHGKLLAPTDRDTNRGRSARQKKKPQQTSRTSARALAPHSATTSPCLSCGPLSAAALGVSSRLVDPPEMELASPHDTPCQSSVSSPDLRPTTAAGTPAPS
ncbi:uncharacterized protein RG961_012410 [Leptosomus discolor]